MKKNVFIYILLFFLFGGILPNKAQDCDLPVAVILGPEFDSEPVVKSNLQNILERLTTNSGMTTDVPLTQFVLTVKVDELDKSVIPGPPIQVIYNLGVSLYMVDAINKNKYSTMYIELDGVGKNETKSYVNAFKRLNVNNKSIIDFISIGKKKILDYYDANYKNILNEARRKADMQQFDEAIAMTVSIPICSKGGRKATEVGLQIYTEYNNLINLKMLNKAKSIWASGQDFSAAEEAGAILSEIDPYAACYDEAVSFAQEIKKQIRKDIDFEMREKYYDSVKLTEQKIAAMKAIGVAFGKGQQPTTTNIMWLK